MRDGRTESPRDRVLCRAGKPTSTTDRPLFRAEHPRIGTTTPCSGRPLKPITGQPAAGKLIIKVEAANEAGPGPDSEFIERLSETS